MGFGRVDRYHPMTVAGYFEVGGDLNRRLSGSVSNMHRCLNLWLMIAMIGVAGCGRAKPASLETVAATATKPTAIDRIRKSISPSLKGNGRQARQDPDSKKRECTPNLHGRRVRRKRLRRSSR